MRRRIVLVPLISPQLRFIITHSHSAAQQQSHVANKQSQHTLTTA